MPPHRNSGANSLKAPVHKNLSSLWHILYINKPAKFWYCRGELLLVRKKTGGTKHSFKDGPQIRYTTQKLPEMITAFMKLKHEREAE